MLNTYLVTYNKPLSPYHSYPQNAVRDMRTAILCGMEEARAFVEKVTADGFNVLHVRNGIGQMISL